MSPQIIEENLKFTLADDITSKMPNARRMIERLRERRRPRRFLERISIDGMEDKDCFRRYRFLPATVMFIVGLLTPALGHQTRRNHSLTVLQQVLVTLRFLATGAVFRLEGDATGISESVVCRTVHNVCQALAGLRNQYIYMPLATEVHRVKTAFHAIAAFPNVIGCIDGTFIRISAPSNNESDFVNRKGYHSINVQMVCDANFRITNVVAKWPGSVHDARIFKNSALSTSMENGTYDGIILGDSGYPCLPYLLTPYLATPTPSHTKYNSSLCKTRVRIEQTFGILKKRFMCLSEKLRVSPDRACTITLACAVLHNIGIERGDILRINVVDDEGMPEQTEHGNPTGEMARNYYREKYFV